MKMKSPRRDIDPGHPFSFQPLRLMSAPQDVGGLMNQSKIQERPPTNSTICKSNDWRLCCRWRAKHQLRRPDVGGPNRFPSPKWWIFKKSFLEITLGFRRFQITHARSRITVSIMQRNLLRFLLACVVESRWKAYGRRFEWTGFNFTSNWFGKSIRKRFLGRFLQTGPLNPTLSLNEIHKMENHLAWIT